MSDQMAKLYTFKKQLSVPEAMIVSLAAMLVLFLALFSMGELSWFHYLPISHRSFGSMLQLSLSCFVAWPSALEAMLRNMVWSWPVAAEAFDVRRATFLRLHMFALNPFFCHFLPPVSAWSWPSDDFSCECHDQHEVAAPWRTMDILACANLQDLTSHRPVARNGRNCHDTSAGCQQQFSPSWVFRTSLLKSTKEYYVKIHCWNMLKYMCHHVSWEQGKSPIPVGRAGRFCLEEPAISWKLTDNGWGRSITFHSN